MGRIRSRLTYANVMVTILAFVVLGGGTALASFVVSSNSQIGPGTVSGHKPPAGKHANLILKSIGAGDLASGSVLPAKFGKLPAAEAGSNENHTVLHSTWTDLPLETERFDTAGLHSTASNPDRMTAPIDGTYVITGSVSWAGNVTSQRSLTIRRNGTTDISFVTQPGFASGPVQSTATVTRLSAGDFVTLHVLQTSGGPLVANYHEEATPELAMA